MNGTARAQANRTLLAALLATVGMLFTAFAAAYLERQTSKGFTRIDLPSLLWINTAVLVFSSITLEIGRRTGRRALYLLTIALGGLFLVGQYFAWLDLREAGVFLPSNPHGSFFYMLTAIHGIHLAAGLVALAVALRRPAIRHLCAGFWHFMGAVWLYVLIVLTVL